MRWRNYFLQDGKELEDFWTAHLQERERRLLFVIGRGFDPRMCLGPQMVLAAGGDGPRDVIALEFQEGETSPSLVHADLVARNWATLQAHLAGRGNISSQPLAFWSPERRRVGPRNAANLFSSLDVLRPYADVIVDISAMPRGIYFPLLARLLYLLDQWPAGEVAPNLHVLVAEDPDLDARIREEGVDEVADFLYSFEGGFNKESTAGLPKVWIPLLGEGRTTQFDRIHDLVKPDEVSPVVPSPSRDPRRADNIVIEYRDFLFDQLRIDPRNIMYASEHNPFEVYRQVRRAVLHYRDVLGLLGGCKVALSALSSKLMSLGALLVAYELKQLSFDVGLAHVECQGFSLDAPETNPRVVGLWLSGECYAS